MYGRQYNELCTRLKNNMFETHLKVLRYSYINEMGLSLYSEREDQIIFYVSYPTMHKTMKFKANIKYNSISKKICRRYIKKYEVNYNNKTISLISV